VFYCYQMVNVGDVRLGVHDLSDDKLGNLLSHHTCDWLPGETFTRIEPAVPIQTIVNSATWTASTDPYVFTVMDVATVNVLRIFLPLVMRARIG
jgi:hypothetical protein